MGNKFDELFDDFFKNRNQSPLDNEISKIIQALSSYKINEIDFEEQIDSDLGEPDDVIEGVDGDFHFKKMIWNTPKGQFIKIIVSDAEPMNDDFMDFMDFEDYEEVGVSLEDQLELAVQEENYDLAIKLRDEIKKNKK